MHRIEAELLIPGRGNPVRGGVVIMDGARISYAGPAALAPETPGAPVSRTVAVMPGLWDCHGHFIGTRNFDLGQLPMDPEPLRAARSTRDLRAALDAGVTSVREVGGLGIYLARAVAEGVLAGPAIYAAGAILSTTGGHGDLHSFPLDWMEDWTRRTGMMRLADGPDECVKAVREQFRRNAKVIKVHASGGVLSEVDDPIHQQFTDPELRAIVEVAALADRVVAAHCHGKPGIMAALRAGVRTIEHGTYLDDECCDAMRESGAILVPTRAIIEDILANKESVPDFALAKLEAMADIHAQAVTRAYEQGVTIAMGTDIAMTGPDLPNAWGQNGAEPGYLVKLGMTPLEAIEAATAIGPLTLGPQAPRSGQLAEGYDADVITLDADPLADVGVLADPDRITRVWTAGRLVKGAAALYRPGEVDLVAERDTVVADLGDLRLVLPGPVDLAGPELGQPEATALVEAERVDVVVGGGEPDLAAAETARLGHHGLDEHGPDPGAAVQRVERDDLQRVGAEQLVGEQPGQAVRPFGDEAGHLGGPQGGAADRDHLRSPQLGDEPAEHRAIALADGPDRDLRLGHPAIMPPSRGPGGAGERPDRLPAARVQRAR